MTPPRLPVRPHLRPKPCPELPQIVGNPPAAKIWWVLRKRPGEPPWYLAMPLDEAESLGWAGEA